MLSAVFRNTIIQFAGPDGMRGRLMGVQMAVVAGGPRLGDLEAGAVATAFGDTVSVVSGGLACVAGALVVAWALPGFTRLHSALHKQADELAEAAVLSNSHRLLTAGLHPHVAGKRRVWVFRRLRRGVPGRPRAGRAWL